MINPDLYYGDYWQLGFVLEERDYYAIAIKEDYDDYEIRVMYIRLVTIPDDFDAFVKQFNDCWWHEYMHIIGMNHEMMGNMDNHTISV